MTAMPDEERNKALLNACRLHCPGRSAKKSSSTTFTTMTTFRQSLTKQAREKHVEEFISG